MGASSSPSSPPSPTYLLHKILAISCLLIPFAYIANNILEFEKLGMEYVIYLQHFRSAPLDIFMRVGSFMGYEFFVVLVPVLAWWGDPKLRKLGINLFILLLYMLFLVSVLKVIFSRPRPLSVNEMIGKATATSALEQLEFSFPSGHSWNAMTFFFLARAFPNLAMWFGATLIAMFAISSRVYFGVHYPHDTAAGVICGLIFLIIFTFVEQFLETLFHSMKVREKGRRVTLSEFFSERATLVSLGLAVVVASIYFMLDPAQRRRQQGLVFAPFCFLGLVLSRPFYLQLNCTSVANRIMRVLTGIPVVFLIMILFHMSPQVWRPLLSVLVGPVIFALLPHLFAKLKITQGVL